MANGKFTKPRSNRSSRREEQEIEQSFRQVTKTQVPAAAGSRRGVSDATVKLPNPTISRNRKIVAISLCTAAAVLLVCLFVGVGFILGGSEDDGRILNNVTVAGINIGGMTPEEAETALHRATDLTYTLEDMVIRLPDTTLRLSPADTGAKLDIKAAVEAAYNYGRTGTQAEREQARAKSLVSTHTIALLPYLNLDLTFIRQTLDTYGASFNSTFSPASYELEGNAPILQGEDFDKNAPCQTLVLTLGTPGQYLDIDKLYNDVLDAYSFNVFLVEAKESIPGEQPTSLDLEAIYQEVCSEPEDAAMDLNTFEITPEVYGYTFDLEKAKQLLEEAEYGETIRIPMEFSEPEVLAEDLEGKLFRDVLGSFRTPHTSDSNRNTNLKLACQAINGMVLNPGDLFDFNEALGKRTEEKGYKPAGAYSAGETVSEVGGGICQVSSTLYYCALLGDLEIVTRQNHSYVSSYIDPGLDATVSWGGPDFRFRNNTAYPIRIEAEVSGGYVSIRLMGTDEKDYYIKLEYTIVATEEYATVYEEYPADNAKGYTDGQVLQYGVNGMTVKSYKCRYDKETNELISRDYEATSRYKKKDHILVTIKPEETQPPETSEPTEESTAPSDTPAEENTP